MSQTHGYWENEDGRTVFFSDYYDVTTYSGVDTNFVVSMPWQEELEGEGFHFPYFIAEGTITGNVPTFTKITIPEDRLTFLDDIDSYNLRYPTVDLYETLSSLASDFGVEPEVEDEDEE